MRRMTDPGARRGDEAGVGDGAEVHEADAVGVGALHALRHRQGELRLANATGTGERQQPRRPQQPGHRLDLVLTPDQAGERHRQLRRVRAGERRRRRGGRPVEAGGGEPVREPLGREADTGQRSGVEAAVEAALLAPGQDGAARAGVRHRQPLLPALDRAPAHAQLRRPAVLRDAARLPQRAQHRAPVG
jgi:hypothetical protein